MFGIFKRKSEKEILITKYQQLKTKAFHLSKTSRKESDEIEAQAFDLLKKIDLIEKTELKKVSIE